jgi:alpha-beta hydrolase superfamily lysophospholipase
MIEHPIWVTTPQERIPGLFWLPDGAAARLPLVLVGHGFTQHKRALFPPKLVDDLTSHGFAVAAIDAPAHGERAPDLTDRAAIDSAWRAHWREFGAWRIASEHSALLDALSEPPEIDASRVGYFGLSLATQYGLGVLASEPRFRAAVLGLSALPDPGPRIAANAARVTCPVFFIQQLDDEVAAADRAVALFDRIGSADKVLRASPGAHMAVPRHVFEEAYAFLDRHLQPRTSNLRPPN